MSRRARKKLKSRTIGVINARKQAAFERSVKKQVQEVNQRLRSLERQHASGTWATGKLQARIKSNKVKGLMYKGKRIRLKPKMTKTDLTQVQKSTKQFLLSKTSTNRGIRDVKGETIKTLKNTLNLDRRKNRKLSDSDAEKLYNMLTNKDFARFNISKKGREDEFIGASALWSEIDYASRTNLSEEDFISRLENLRKQDFSVDDRLAASRIYNLYVL